MNTIPLGVYRHYKGNLYEVIGFAKHSETCEEMVIYKALYGERGTWVRPVSMWNEIVEVNGKNVARFEIFVDDGQELLNNIEKIHTTELGAERIRRNLALGVDDVVDWCKQTIANSNRIARKGKNWYAHKGNVVITVNAKSYTIITAHKTNCTTRLIKSTDRLLLEDFIYHAIFIPPDAEKPSRDIIKQPDISIYIDGFGSQPGDFGVIAEIEGKAVGAAWTRIIPAYGHIDNETPELATSVLPEYRGQGIGTMLIHRLFNLLCERGYKNTSLAVQQKNDAVRFYQRLGYVIVRETDEEFIMLKDLTKVV